MKPSYLVIGAQKSATSSVCGLLGQHPDVFMTMPKELHFFSEPEAWARGWSWYESFFEDAAGLSAIGEGSTTYSMQALFPEAAARIAKHLPDTRLLYLVRHPLRRIQSHWMHLRSKGNREVRAFNTAVREDVQYVENSLYLKQIDVYRRMYADERIHVEFFEDFEADPTAVIARCFSFLDVDPDVPLEDPWLPRHVSAEGLVDGHLMAPLRKVPGFSRLRDAAPMGLRNILRSRFKRSFDGRPEWDDETLRWVIEQVFDDSRAFLQRYRKPVDFWAPTRRSPPKSLRH